MILCKIFSEKKTTMQRNAEQGYWNDEVPYIEDNSLSQEY